MQVAAECVGQLLAGWPERGALREQIATCEEEGDRITRQMVQVLHRSRMKPFHRDEVYSLAQTIDDVVDEIEEVSEELAAYGIEAPMEQAQELATVVRDSARVVRRALDRLKQHEGIVEEAIEVRELEHDADRIYREGLASLFEGGIDPMLVLRWKDVYQGLEDAVDRTRRAMDLIGGISLKYS